jgi:outer membrane protein OmpA-like peptidoglycan-associated protein
MKRTRSTPPLVRLAALASTACLVLLCSSATSGASTTTQIRPASSTEASGPSSTGSSFDAVTCTSASSCVAVGQLGVATGGVALIDVESSGNWKYVKPPAPSDSSTASPNNLLDAVSCPSAKSCVAVGYYANSFAGSTHQQALLEVQTAGSWSAVAAPLPAGASTSPQNAFDSVSCVSVGNCVAVGTYLDSGGNQEALLVVDTGGTWSNVNAPLPSDAVTSSQDNTLDAVTCTSPVDCVAVGSYVNTSPTSTCTNKDCLQGLVDVESSGTWAAVIAPLPPNATSSPQNGNSIATVTCTSTSNCVAAGSYVDTGANNDPLLLVETSSTWAAVVAPLPGDASVDPNTDSFASVTCVSQGNCVAVGQYDNAQQDPEGLIDTETSGSWSSTTAPVPGDADTAMPDVALASVSCTTLTSCVTVGSYGVPPIRNLSPDALVDAEVGGVWMAGIVDLPGDASTAQPYSDLSDVACVSAWNCVAVGLYVNTQGLYQVILDAFGVGLSTLPVVPGPPNTVVAAVGHGQAVVGWIPPSSDGGAPITSYTVTASPGGASCSTAALRCRIWPLRGDTTYTFTVVATNEVGASPPSMSSYPVATWPVINSSVTIGPFARNSSHLTEVLHLQINKLAATILTGGDNRISIVGYSDAKGTPAQIAAVSIRRARSVAAALRIALTSLHAGPTSISVSERGAASPVASNKTTYGRVLNRRVVATLT